MTDRQWTGHFLKGNASNQRPSNFVFVHCETTQEKVNHVKPYIRHKLHTGVAVAVEWRKHRGMREKWFTFVHADVFWSWLCEWQKKRHTLWVVMHDAFRNLNILNLWEQMEDERYQTWKPGREYRDPRTGEMRKSEPWVGMKAIEGKPFHLETEGPKGRVNFTDIRNYYPCSLEKLRESMELTVDLNDKICELYEPECLQCANCTEVIKLAYLRLLERWEKEKNGNWQFSASGLAWSNYRHKFMHEPVAIHNHAEALHLEWECYNGGETRCWFRGRVDKPLVHYDVNSLYPYVMLDNMYPTALIDHFKGDCYDKLSTYIDKYCTAAEVTLNSEVDCYPYRDGGKIIYPVGVFRTVLCGPELLRAYDSGHINAVHSLSIYTGGNIFSPYVLHWWSEKYLCKKKGDKAGELFAKLMLNSLPAKFAQRSPMWVDNGEIPVVKPWRVFPWKDPLTGTVYPARSVGWQGQYLSGRKPTENDFPLIFAYVTAYARGYMRALRKSIPKHLLYYQDTDSLILSDCSVECIADANWRIGTGIGQLKVIGTYQSAEFRGPKNYTVDSKNVIAGVKAEDLAHSSTEFSGLREERSSSLFMRPHDGSHRAVVVDLSLPGTTAGQQYDEHGWAIPVRLP